MNEKATPHFIIIDDDPVNNIICLKVIEGAVPEASVQTFTDAETGLKHIQSNYSDTDAHNAILFLDVNMPSLTGWDVLDRFKSFSDDAKAHVKIFMLSSSVNSADKDRAAKNQLVSGFLSKPLSWHLVYSVLSDYAKIA